MGFQAVVEIAADGEGILTWQLIIGLLFVGALGVWFAWLFACKYEDLVRPLPTRRRNSETDRTKH